MVKIKRGFWSKAKIIWGSVIAVMIIGIGTLAYLYFFTTTLSFLAAPTPGQFSPDIATLSTGTTFNVSVYLPSYKDRKVSLGIGSGSCRSVLFSGERAKTVVQGFAIWQISFPKACDITQLQAFVYYKNVNGIQAIFSQKTSIKIKDPEAADQALDFRKSVLSTSRDWLGYDTNEGRDVYCTKITYKFFRNDGAPVDDGAKLQADFTGEKRVDFAKTIGVGDKCFGTQSGIASVNSVAQPLVAQKDSSGKVIARSITLAFLDLEARKDAEPDVKVNFTVTVPRRTASFIPEPVSRLAWNFSVTADKILNWVNPWKNQQNITAAWEQEEGTSWSLYVIGTQYTLSMSAVCTESFKGGSVTKTHDKKEALYSGKYGSLAGIDIGPGRINSTTAGQVVTCTVSKVEMDPGGLTVTKSTVDPNSTEGKENSTLQASGFKNIEHTWTYTVRTILRQASPPPTGFKTEPSEGGGKPPSGK